MTRAELIAALDAVGCKDDDDVWVTDVDNDNTCEPNDVMKLQDECGEFFAIVIGA